MDDTLWSYPDDDSTTIGADLAGYSVEAVDGEIGHVDRATSDVDTAHLVVDTGPWIFGRKVVVPAGAVESIDHDDRRIVLRLTKQQIKDSPPLADAELVDPMHLDDVGLYYGRIRTW